MRRVAGILAIGLAGAPLAGCEQTTASSLTLTSAAPASTVAFPVAIARARAARDHAAQLQAPSAVDVSSSSDDAVSKALRQWASSRRDATQEAHRAYTEALRSALTPGDEAQVYGELAELWLRLAEDTRSALFAATPAKYRNDPSFVGAVQSATVYALRPLLNRVKTHLAACQRIAGDDASATAAAKNCAALALRLNDLDDPRGPGAPHDEPKIAVRPLVPTTRPTPCTFKGSLAARGLIYKDETGPSSIVLPMSPDTPIEVESLAVPRVAGGRYKVVVSWPKAVEGYLQAEDGLLTLTRGVEIAPGTVWAKEGDRVTASDPRGPTVRVVRPKGDSARASESTLKPGALERRLFCHDLALATAPIASTRSPASP